MGCRVKADIDNTFKFCFIAEPGNSEAIEVCEIKGDFLK